MNAPEPGTVLAGKYRVEQVLGVGGMGAVVAAYHMQLDQRVAIKYLLPEAMKNPEVVERFSREARAAAKIRGEHVARVIDVGQFDDGAPYMIMEYLEGSDLARLLEKSGPLSFEDAVRYILETCEALAEAHAAKIVHRDLKPANLFLAKQPDKRSIIKVLDFGISKVGENAQSAALTKTSALMGTAFYMSPEQMTAPKTVDHRSDIWSLGVILYELLAGRPPFPGETVAEIIAGILTNQPESLRKYRNDIPSGLKTVVDTCMQSKAADRYQSVAQLAVALGPFAAPSDRGSIEVTARVLGESVRPGAVGPVSAQPQISIPTPIQQGTVVLPSSATVASHAPNPPNVSHAPHPPPSAVPQSAVAASVAMPSASVGSTTGGGVAGTMHNVSSSAITQKPRSMAATIGIVGFLLVGIGVGVGVVVTSKDGGTPPAPTGMVGTPASETTPTSNLPASSPTTIATLVDTATPTAATTETAPAATTAVPGTKPGTIPIVPKPTVSTIKSATPSATVSAVASVPPVVPTAPTATGTSSSKNPLNMGIK